MRWKYYSGYILVSFVFVLIGFMVIKLWDLNGQNSNTPSQTIENSHAEDTTIIAFGDSGTGSKEQGIIAALIEQEQFDAVLHLGDIAYPDGTAEQIDRYFSDIYGPRTKSSIYPALGNHDYQTDNAIPTLSLFKIESNPINEVDFERYYSFDINGIHFVALDTNTPLELANDLNQEDMIDWLDKDLSLLSPDTPVIVYFHHPPFSIGKYGNNQQVIDKIIPLIDKHSVDLVISGHDHNYQRTCKLDYTESGLACSRNGTTYLVSGGGGAPIYDVKESQLHFIKALPKHHYLKITYNPQIRTYTVTAIGLDGLAFDTFDVTRD